MLVIHIYSKCHEILEWDLGLQEAASGQWNGLRESRHGTSWSREQDEKGLEEFVLVAVSLNHGDH